MKPILDSDGKQWPSFPQQCPKCGREVEWGFGLAGGGYGTYVSCGDLDAEPGCDWMAKRQAEDDE